MSDSDTATPTNVSGRFGGAGLLAEGKVQQQRRTSTSITKHYRRSVPARRYEPTVLFPSSQSVFEKFLDLGRGVRVTMSLCLEIPRLA
ncbi:MAG TPA: hypothetical protein VLL82_03700 [Mycobacterium sp.]|nr:hypothetical protein [Mycobacterium sp.]